MKEGSTVLLPDGSQATLIRLPQSKGRKRPRALVSIGGNEVWVFVDELKEVPDEAQAQ